MCIHFPSPYNAHTLYAEHWRNFCSKVSLVCHVYWSLALQHSMLHMCSLDTLLAVCVSPPIMCKLVSLNIPFQCAFAFPSRSCSIYNGSLCTSVFHQANMSNPPGGSADDRVRNVFSFISAGYGQTCRNYLVSLACIATVSPCAGSAWCGSMSKDELKRTITSACVCEGSSYFITFENMSNVANIILIISSIDRLPNYFKGSSTTGPDGNSSLTCQDVTVGKTCTCI